MTDALAWLKQQAGSKAVEFVQSGMRVGLGTGSTAIFATRRIAELIHAGALRDIVVFATSKATSSRNPGSALESSARSTRSSQRSRRKQPQAQKHHERDRQQHHRERNGRFEVALQRGIHGERQRPRHA